MELDLEVFFTGQDTLDMPVYKRLYTFLDGRGLLIGKLPIFNKETVAGGLRMLCPGYPINIKYIWTDGGGKCHYIIKQRNCLRTSNKQPQCYPDVAGLIAELYGTELMPDNINNSSNMIRSSSNMTKKNSSNKSTNKRRNRLASRAASVITTDTQDITDIH